MVEQVGGLDRINENMMMNEVALGATEQYPIAEEKTGLESDSNLVNLKEIITLQSDAEVEVVEQQQEEEEQKRQSPQEQERNSLVQTTVGLEKKRSDLKKRRSATKRAYIQLDRKHSLTERPQEVDVKRDFSISTRYRSLSSPRNGMEKLKLFILLPENAHQFSLTTVAAPVFVFSKRCEVSTISEHGSVELGNKTHLKTHYTYDDAPRDVDVLVVLGGLKASKSKLFLEKFTDKEEKPMLVRLKHGITVFKGNMRRDVDLNTHQATSVDTSLDMLDIIYDIHKELETAQPSEEDGEEYESSSCSPGDMVAEEMSYYRHCCESQQELERFVESPKNKTKEVLNKLKRSLSAFFQEKLVGILMYEGMNELAYSLIHDTWEKVPGCRVVSVMYSTKNQDNNAKHADSVKTQNQLVFENIRLLGDFCTIPVAVNSLDLLLIPPGQFPAHMGKLNARTVLKMHKELHKIEVLDHTALSLTETISTQLALIETKYSLHTARHVARKLALV